MKDFQFQMWAECGGYGPNCGHSKCQQIDKIVDVIPCTSIEVWGKIEEKKYTIREEDVTYYIFTVSRWEESP